MSEGREASTSATAGASAQEAPTDMSSGPIMAPSPADVASIVSANRHVRGWKVSVLAEMAAVSVSTVERVERGEFVSTEMLDRIAEALGFAPGDFWRPRRTRTPEEALKATMRHLEGQQIVPCRVFSRMTDAAAVIAAVAIYVVVQGPGHPDSTTAELVSTLRETIDLMSFATSDALEPKARIRPRQAQQDVLQAVAAVARRGYTPLLATYEADTPWGRAPAAAISFHPRLHDPGAPKRRELIVPTAIRRDELGWSQG